MTATDQLVDNPYVTIKNEEIDICYGKKTYKLALDMVSKMYLTRKKANYWSAIPGMSFFMDKKYNLCIEIRDKQDIHIDVKAYEKQYFIDPIALVRRLKNRTS